MPTILMKPSIYEKKFTKEIIFHLGEGFSIYYEGAVLKRNIFGKKKYYRVKFTTNQNQKFIIDILKNYFFIFS